MLDLRIEEITEMLERHITVALSMTVLVALLFYAGYRIVYLKWLKGMRRLSMWQLSLLFVFMLYVVTVCALTLLGRGSNFSGSVNLHLFSSYVEAWHHFSLRDWQYIYFNIAMFVPLGLMLPLLHKRFARIGSVVLVALLFTGLIEGMQFVTGVGIFELDDLFNNVLGAVIGFGLVQAVRTRKAWWWRIMYVTPVLLVVSLTAIMLSYYEQKEFGNLAIIPSVNVKMEDVKLKTDVVFSNEETMAAVYEAPKISSEEGKVLAYNLFEQLGIDTKENIELIAYQNEANYRYHGDPTYFIWVNYLNSSFELTDFSSFEVEKADADEQTLKNALLQLNINVPEQVVFERQETGRYSWQANNHKIGDQLLDGALTVEYYEDNTLKSIHHALVTYDKVRDVPIISEAAAFKENGNFELYRKDIQELIVKGVRLDFFLDSKVFLQPVYAFEVMLDGEQGEVFIPAKA